MEFTTAPSSETHGRTTWVLERRIQDDEESLRQKGNKESRLPGFTQALLWSSMVPGRHVALALTAGGIFDEWAGNKWQYSLLN